MSGYRVGWLPRGMQPPEPEPDPLVEFGGLALDAVHKARQELLVERQVSRFLAETLATEGKWTTEQWLDQGRLAVEGVCQNCCGEGIIVAPGAPGHQCSECRGTGKSS